MSASRNTNETTSPNTNRGNRNQQQRNRIATPTVIKFKGHTTELAGFIFDCGDHKQADVYTTTVKRIAEYVGATYKHGGDISSSISNGNLIKIKEPTQPPDYTNPSKITRAEKLADMTFSKKLDAHFKREEVLYDNNQKAYALILGQCTDLLQTKLKQQDAWSDISTELDAIGLLRLIKTITFRFEDQKFLPLALLQAKSNLYSFRQGSMTNAEYLQRFKNLADVAMSYDGQIHDQAITNIVFRRLHPASKQKNKNISYESLTDEQKDTIQSGASDLALSTLFVANSDRRRYGRLSEELENDFTRGRDDYPEDLVQAFRLLNEYKNWNPRQSIPEPTGVAFSQKGRSNGPKPIEEWHKDATCHGCGKKGHIRPNCPEDPEENNNTTKEKKGVTFVQDSTESAPTTEAEEENSGPPNQDAHEHCKWGFCNPRSDSIKDLDLRTLVLLDNQSTVDLFCNRSLVRNIWHTKESMTIRGNGGSLTTNRKAYVENYGEVWFDYRAITNILSLKNVKEKFRVTYDSAAHQGRFTVHKPNGSNVHFDMHVDGLHYHNTISEFNSQPGFAMVLTVQDTSEGHSQRQILQAKSARAFQAIVGHPSTSDLKSILKSNQIMNCPITPEDVDRAETIFGPSVPILKGKTTRQSTTPVVSDYVSVPPQILQANKHVAIAADIFFVNKVPFLATISEHIKFTTTQHIPSRKLIQVLQAFKESQSIYTSRGFNVHTALMDGEFAALRQPLADCSVTLNLTAANEHVPRIERQIRVIKERVRATRHTLPFKFVPLLMVIELIHTTTLWLNAFPPKGGVSTHLSPRSIMTGVQLDFNKHCQLPFGSYVQAHQEPHPTNTQEARTVGAICLGPTGNRQGSYKFLNLKTGKLLLRRSWTHLPMPQEVIDRVNALGKAEGQPELLTFFDRRGRPIGDLQPHENTMPDAGVLTEPPTDLDEDIFDGPLAEGIETQDPIEPQLGHDTDSEQTPEDRFEMQQEPQAEPQFALEDETEQETYEHEPETATIQEEDQSPAHVDVTEAYMDMPQDDTTAPQQNNTWVRRSSRHQTSPHEYAPRLYGQSYVNASNQHVASGTAISHPNSNCASTYTLVEHYIMTQLSLKAGLKRWKGSAEKGVSNELHQLHFRDSFIPIDPTTLSKEEYEATLESHLFLKEKRDGTIKGRLVGGGNKQRGTITKEESASPTAATESVILTAVIEAKEGRDVATIDIPNAFIQTKLEDDADKAVMRMRGKLAELMVKIAPEIYRKYVVVDANGHMILYVRLQNALYGLIKAALLYYKRFVKDLKSIGFILNPYDPCVANKIVNGEQLTVVWHVDDLKVSHKDPAVVTRMANWLKATYERLFEDGTGAMTLHRGKIHEYLGMTLDYSVPGEINISMVPYIKEMVQQFSQYDEDQDKTATTPAAEHLFTIDETKATLPEKQAAIFHHFVAKALFATKRSRPDIATAVAFLTTRVKSPSDDDWKKLIRLMRYLRGTLELSLTLSASTPTILKWYVDGSHTIHPDMRGQTGGGLTLGKGMLITGSTKQKLNTRSSTETELVAADDYMPIILWTNHFLKAQGYNSENTILYQDNQSAILLETNGRQSSSRRTKHLNVRYFFITDRVRNGDLSVEYCPTGEMISDYFTKPLQGQLFIKFRNMIMNIKDKASH